VRAAGSDDVSRCGFRGSPYLGAAFGGCQDCSGGGGADAAGVAADGSASSSGITQYLKGKCPASWVNAAGAAYSTGSAFPSVPGTIAVQGSQGMADAIDATPNAIGYMDAGHGHEKGFAEIALKNRDGVYLTSKNANIGAAALAVLAANAFPVNATLDFSAVNLYDQAGPTTWPIVLISYFYLDRNLTSMDALSASVLDYFV
jgi:phosphate transport system substrate-binding protein